MGLGQASAIDEVEWHPEAREQNHKKAIKWLILRKIILKAASLWLSKDVQFPAMLWAPFERHSPPCAGKDVLAHQ